MSNPRPRPRPLPIPPSQISRNHGSGSSCDSSEASGKQTNVNSGEYSRTGSPFTPPQTMLTSPNQPGILVQSPMSGEQPGSPRPPWWKLSPRFEELQLPNEEKSQFIRSTPPKRPRPLPIPGASSSDTRPPPVKEAPPPDPSSSTLPLNIYPKHLKMLVDFQVSTGQESFSSDTNWRTFAPNHVAQNLNAAESKRQDLIFELIKSEKQYLYHLEAINDLYVQPLQSSSLTIVHPDRRRPFTQDISYRIDEIRALHQKLLTTLYEVQRREFPLIQGIAAPMFDTFILDFREIYLSYIVHIPVALAVAEDELENNILFNDFHESIVTRPATRGLDLKMLINAPYKRLSKYGELVTAIIEANTRDGSVSPTGDSSSRELESELLREFAASVRDVVRLGTFQGSMNTPTPAQPAT
ncbi:hypothetical protein FRC03_001000 [Tulasnella sp. 419]|nr:hypothetical protein FRC03_001000 [Tulasnella sp. 419]